MAFYLWNWHDYFRKLPPAKFINSGRRKWDQGSEFQSTNTATSTSNKTIFTMPCFALHGRWGNMVFQYIFMRVLALQNNGEIELNRAGIDLNNTFSLYQDMQDIPNVQTKSSIMVLDSFRIFPMFLDFIPHFFWRAMYVTNVRLQKCFILNNVDEAINSKNILPDEPVIEVEGVFMFSTKFYKKQHKDYILRNLLQPATDFNAVINECIQGMGKEKTIIGIHIRRGDYVSNSLGNFGQFPIAVKFITNWLTANIRLVKNPAIYVCSDDQDAYKEVEMAGFEVFTTKKLLPEGGDFTTVEQLDWEILRRCDILLTSNSSFSFSSAFLSTKSPNCYQFSVRQRRYVPFDPWASEPLQSSFSSPYLGGYLYSRFTLVWQMVSPKAAFKRLLKDIINYLMFLMLFKVLYLRYAHGFSIKFFTKLINIFKIFQLFPKAPFSDNRYNIRFGKKPSVKKFPERKKQFSE